MNPRAQGFDASDAIQKNRNNRQAATAPKPRFGGCTRMMMDASRYFFSLFQVRGIDHFQSDFGNDPIVVRCERRFLDRFRASADLSTRFHEQAGSRTRIEQTVLWHKPNRRTIKFQRGGMFRLRVLRCAGSKGAVTDRNPSGLHPFFSFGHRDDRDHPPSQKL